ncbi:DoxX family protein [Pseudozobellia thermophila]|uniref:Uncharacterized membrane protein n=1 Tax=Pseudozobellia thermophila TaxID=192903 RepID=A0A1M6ND98_9FLAO|nr:hypothetical protein [Pseudozobellia thermophila]SHJ93691.1 Uncharacterized membrane protein [Pseudozobellia thermophila]
MKPLIVLLATFAISLVVLKLKRGTCDYALSARTGMTVMLLFTAMGHFMFTKGMALMVPDFIPFKTEMVYFTGLVEILAALALQVPRLRVVTAWLLILFFVLMLPANIKASLETIDYQKGTYNGNGPMYLWFRIPLQVFFVLWVYLSAIKASWQ